MHYNGEAGRGRYTVILDLSSPSSPISPYLTWMTDSMRDSHKAERIQYFKNNLF